MNDKILPTHLDRHAAIYLRQSTLKQVLEHRESTARQYALQDRTDGEYERSHEKTHGAEREGPHTKHDHATLWRAQCRSNVTPIAECDRRPSRRPAVRRPVGRPTPRPSGRIWGSSAP